MFFELGRKGAIRPRRVREHLPLSPNEERYILAETVTGQAYMNLSAVRILGKADMGRMQEIIQATCDRHEARRTGFEPSSSGGFTKYVEDRARVRLKFISMPGASEAALQAAVRAHVYAKGDFSAGALHRFLVIEVGPEDHVVGIGMHHATSDGMTSTAFMVEMFSRLLGYEINQDPPQYSDYWDFDWKTSDAYKAAETFWRDRMSGLEAAGVWPADRGNMPPGGVRPGVMLTVPAEIATATQRAAEAIGATHFTFFYAAYLAHLARLTGTDRVCTTFQSAGRRGKPGAEAAHGVFSNSLILGTRVDETESVRTLASRLRGEIREAIAHEIFPYHHVIRSTGVHPRYAINWYPQAPSAAGVQGITFTGINIVENQDDDDLNLRFTIHDGVMTMAVYYDPQMFAAERVCAMGEQLIALAGALAADVDAPIAATRSVGLAAAGLLPDPAAPLPRGGEALIHAAFLDRARETPQAVAIEHNGATVTYGELERGSRALAQRLRAAGLGPQDRVAILADRGPELIRAMLAVSRIGGVFVTLDSAYPEPRLASLAEIAAPRGIVTAGAPGLTPLAERLAQPLRATVLRAGSPAHRADAELTGLDQARPDDPAYILFTSGSTGRPKGVACSHAPLSRFVGWQAAAFGLSARDRVTMLSGLSHDPLLRDVFAPLSLGATLVIPDQATILEPGALARWLRDAGATVVHLTPALGQILAAEAARSQPLTALRRMFWGGDILRPTLLAQLAALAPNAEHVNFYGCTETPQAAAFWRFDGDANWAAAPIGVGVDGFQLLVVDPATKAPLGIGEVGEIAVRSNFLSLGYVDAGRIVAPTDRGADGDIYYTGDRGLYLPDGAVLMVGRADDQVKIRGHRVELAEVTAALLARPQVRAAIALPTGQGAQMRITGFVAGPRQSAFDEAEMRDALAARLPDHMVPHAIRWVETLPLSPNGKVDRGALVAQLEAGEAPRAPTRAPNARERALMDAWADVLGAREAISIDSTFARLGGDSLSYVQAFLALEEVIGEPPDGWQLMTIAQLAASRRAVADGWSVVDMPILIRAASIFLIVAHHFSLIDYGGGATSILMMVSGFMLGGLALPEAFSLGQAAPLLRNVRNILFPTLIMSLAICAFRMPGHGPQPYILLMAADLQDYNRTHNAQELYLWYVHCLLHLMLLIYLAVLGLKALGGMKIGPRRFLYGLFAVACVGRFIFPWFLDHGFYSPAHHRDMIYMLPTTHLATLVLGGLAATAASREERLWLIPVVLVYAALSGWCFGPSQGVFLACGLLLVATPRLRMPKWGSAAVFALAGASLWIYLTHMIVRDGLRHIPGLGAPLLGFVVAMAFGVGFWMLWRRGEGFITQALKRPVRVTADAAA